MKLFALPLFAVLFLAGQVCAQPVPILDQMIERAAKLRVGGQYAEAVEEITRAIEREPKNARLYILRAETNSMLDRKDLMTQDAAKAVSLAPTDQQVLYQAAQLYRQAQQLGMALKISNHLIKLGPADSDAWSQRIVIKMQLADFAGAYADATRAAGLFPEINTFRLYQASIARQTGDAEKSFAMLDALVAAVEKQYAAAKDENDKRRLERDLTALYFNRAGLRFAKQENEGAKSDLRRAIEFRPDEMTYLQRAQIYRQNQMYDEALADIAQAMKTSRQPNPLIFLIERGDVYYCQGKYAEAIDDFEKVIRLGEPNIAEPMQMRIELARRKLKGN